MTYDMQQYHTLAVPHIHNNNDNNKNENQNYITVGYSRVIHTV